MDKGKWIKPERNMGDVCPVFRKEWDSLELPVKAELTITALGVYSAYLNGERVSDYVLAPGWTVYEKRLQYQTYDITQMLERENRLEIIVGKGWYRSPMLGCAGSRRASRRMSQPAGLYGRICFTYKDGRKEILITDSSWECGESAVRFSEIYDGESYQAGFVNHVWENAVEFEGPAGSLTAQEGEPIKEQEVIEAKEIVKTPSGETVIDFGQEITGYVEFSVDAHAGDEVQILHGEVLDAQGNFYNENYRGAKAEIHYICKEGKQSWHPLLTFFGFRYIKLKEFPGEVKAEQFRAIAVYSDIKKTGELSCSDEDLNQFFSNVFWGQRCNFLDVPTDCPQRDERLGWTGDAQVFIKTASYNFDVEKFFVKWLHDMAAEQFENGGISHVVPDWFDYGKVSAAWGDAAAICPWQIYQTYGNQKLLQEMYGCMKKWVDYVGNVTKEKYLWTGGEHFGDWLGLDAPAGSYKGSTRDDFIASAFYAHSVELVVKAGKVLGEAVEVYEDLYKKIRSTFCRKFEDCRTQTEYVLALWFDLLEEPQKKADMLAGMIMKDGMQLRTGFVGTPYLLHALSKYGYTELAYTLLLRREYPSWLYPVSKGATTIWEHWDGIDEKGAFWSPEMNSFNHYAYGAAADWVYEVAAGIKPLEDYPGFQKVRIEPIPDRRLRWLKACIETRQGKISSKWIRRDDGFRYEIETAVPAEVIIDGKSRKVKAGKYIFYGI